MVYFYVLTLDYCETYTFSNPAKIEKEMVKFQIPFKFNSSKHSSNTRRLLDAVMKKVIPARK